MGLALRGKPARRGRQCAKEVLLLMLAVMPNVSVPQTATQPSSPWQDAYSRRKLPARYNDFLSSACFRTRTRRNGRTHILSAPTRRAAKPSRSWNSCTYRVIGRALGVVQCTFFYNDKTMNRPEVAALMLGDLGFSDKFFFISEDGHQGSRDSFSSNREVQAASTGIS